MEQKWEWVPIDDIIPYENNARKHTEESIETVANSIKQFGWKNAIAIDEDNVILAGHGRRLAALKLGLKEVPVIRFNDLSEEQKKAYRLADNKTAENSGWDFPALDLELDDITNIDMADFGFLDMQDEPSERNSVAFDADTFDVIVTLENEADAEELYNEMKGRGYECRVSTL